MNETRHFTRRRFMAGASGLAVALKPLSLLKVLAVASRAVAQACVDLLDVDGHIRLDLPSLRDDLTVGAARNDLREALARASISFEEPLDPSDGEIGERLLATTAGFSLDVLFDDAGRATSYLLRGSAICFKGVREGFSMGTLKERFPQYEILASPDLGPPFFVTQEGVSFELSSPPDWEAQLAAGNPPATIVTDNLAVTGLVVWR